MVADNLPVLPVVAPNRVLGCERAFGRASTKLVTADLRTMAHCGLAAFQCVQLHPAGSAREGCLASARAACSTEPDVLDSAHRSFERSLTSACGGDPPRVAVPLLQASSGLGFEQLDGLCQQSAGLPLTSLAAMSSCVKTATSCRAERTLAIAMPRLGDLLAPLFDVDSSGACVPSPTGRITSITDPAQAKLAVSCQASMITAGRKLLLRRLSVTRKCADSLLECRLTARPVNACRQIASRCRAQLGALTNGVPIGSGGVSEQLGLTAQLTNDVIAACRQLAPPSLLGAGGLGFDAVAARCNAWGAGPLDESAADENCPLADCVPDAAGDCVPDVGSCVFNAIGTCLGNAFDCAATAVVRYALPFAEEELGRYGVALTQNPYCPKGSTTSVTWTSDPVEPANLLDVQLKDVRPTQTVIGYDEIYYKLGRYSSTKDEAGGGHNKRFDDWCEDNGQVEARTVPPGAQLRDPSSFTCALPIGSETADTINLMKTVVVGPGGQLYLEDGHHAFVEYWAQPDGGPDAHIRVRVLRDLSHLSPAAFWQEMQAIGGVWLLDEDNQPITVDDLPQDFRLSSFNNDVYRGLVFFTRDIGYSVPVTMPEYLEFQWGLWLRQHIDVSHFNLFDFASYLELVKTASQAMAGLGYWDFVTDDLVAGELGQIPWNGGLPDNAGEFAKLSKPISNKSPGHLAFAVDYKGSLGGSEPGNGGRVERSGCRSMTEVVTTSGRRRAPRQTVDGESSMMKVVTAAVAGAAALVLAVGSPAHAKATHTQKCEAAKLKLVAKKASCELTIAAKAGTDFSKCVGAFGSAFGRVKTTCNGAEASLESQVDTFRAEITTALTPATSKCEAKKIKATAKKQACELAVDGTSILKGTSLAFGKCRTPFMNTFRKLEAKGGCGTAGDAGTIEGDVDAFVAGVFSEVNGGTGATTTTTTIVGGTTTTTLLGTVDTLDVVRVGDGTEDLSVDAADSVFIDRYHLDGSSGGASIALPTAASGSNHPFTQGGAETEGMLSRSADGRYLTLAGYAAVPGTAGVSVTDSATVQRVVARVDATGTVDTSTLLGTSAYTGNNIRGATTVDGSAFWTSGAGKTGGGVWYATLGGGTTTQVEISSISTIRAIEIFAGQLFGTGNNAGFKQVFTIGSGLPTTAGQTATTLPGMTDGSPFAFLLLDRNPSVPGLDTLYVADNSTLPIGGIQKWTFDGSNWTLTNTFTAGLSAPVRGLTGFVSGANVTLAATTNEATGNNLVLLVDDGSASPSATTIATAAATEQFRGVALALQ